MHQNPRNWAEGSTSLTDDTVMEKLLALEGYSGEIGSDGFHDARSIARLAQCLVCSLPLQHPRTLPCGNSICLRCLPQFYPRQNISYPGLPSRQDGFQCPFSECQKEHSVADCTLDVTLSKVMEIFERELGGCRSEEMPVEVKEILDPELSDFESDGGECGERKWTVNGGRLVAIYTLIKQGELYYDTDVICTSLAPDHRDSAVLDREVLQTLKGKIMSEMECQVCYGLFLDPITTYCGHTFCRKCLERVLDHSRDCPACRRRLHLPNVLPAQSSNKRLTELLVSLCSEALTHRATVVAIEEMAGSDDDDLTTPLFVCTASYPGMPTPLHIFEPRYRLMIRRVCENGTRRFGMLLPNRSGQQQGELGAAPFMQYGTMLQIEGANMYPDGRSDIWTVGVSRFRVKRWGIRDDYIVSDIERVDDIPILEEEALEALETSLRIQMSSPDLLPPWTRLSTQSLLQIGHNFVDQMQAISAPWLHENNILAFGQRPDDPAMFPYWLASVLPVAENEKYRLLVCTSVRERLKMVVGWIKKIESHRWLVQLIRLLPDFMKLKTFVIYRFSPATCAIV